MRYRSEPRAVLVLSISFLSMLAMCSAASAQTQSPSLSGRPPAPLRIVLFGRPTLGQVLMSRVYNGLQQAAASARQLHVASASQRI